MTERRHDGRGTPLRRLPALFLAFGVAAAALVACVGFERRDDVPVGPRQGWWDGFGPVVRHEDFPSDCSLCHESGSWNRLREDFRFDHEAETGVLLNGAHASARCLRCHNDRGPVEEFAARGCAGCHEDVHRGQMGRRCESCHEDENRWRVADAIADHDRTRFPLVGAHAAAACFRCHPGAQVGVFARADTDCVTCHREDLARAVMPDHVSSGFVDDCERCHVPIAWTGANFVHSFFPLSGGHAGLDCNECHMGGNFAGTPTACSACHLDDYMVTTDPPHAMAGFPTSCENCHTIAGWEGADFDHSGFALTGGHGGLACAACHGGGVYAGTPTACMACHLADYQATTMPNHTTSGFPTSCESCHGTATWQGAVFDHEFPIQGGNHGGLDCADCHTVPTNFAAFSCIDCHEHNAGDTNDDHDRVDGYAYLSSACYSCHPDGND